MSVFSFQSQQIPIWFDVRGTEAFSPFPHLPLPSPPTKKKIAPHLLMVCWDLIFYHQ